MSCKPRRRATPSTRRTVWAQFLGLTLLVVVTSLTVGVLVRKLGEPTQPQSLGLMKIGEVGPRALEQPGWEHRLIPGVEPASTAMAMPLPKVEIEPVAAVPVPPAEPVVPEPAPEPVVETLDEAAPMFNGRPLRKVRTIRMLVTAYSPDERSCPGTADGITASGYSVWTNGMKMVAADTSLLPFGSIVSVPGYNGGNPVPVLDRGGAIKGKRLDVLYPTHEVATLWGAQRLEVTVWEYAD